MRKRYITLSAIIMAWAFFAVPAQSGSLENFANALEDAADVSRAADRAQQSMRDVMEGNHYRDDYYYDDYDDRGRHYGHHKNYYKKQVKEWRKARRHEYERRHRHHRHHDDD